jgi:hypothetical protein
MYDNPKSRYNPVRGSEAVMGVESFQVTLEGGHADRTELDAALRAIAGMRLDPLPAFTPASTNYLFDDGSHIVELQLDDTPVRVSCRFALCHPDTIDSAFIGLVRLLMDRSGMDATIRDDVRPEHERPFPPADFAEFAACLPEYIAVRRREWIAAFGPDRMAATTAECWQWVIHTHCRPTVVQP